MFPLLILAKSICLLFHLTYVKSNLIDAQKASQGKDAPPPEWGQNPNFPRKALRFIKWDSLSS